MLGFVLTLLFIKPTDLKTPPAERTRVLQAGTGKVHPTEKDAVKVFYILWDGNGNVVEAMNGNKFAVVGFHDMSPAWRADILKMVVGEQRRTWSDANTIIDTELLDIMPAPETPPDVAAPPADATVTPSGLAYKVLVAGTGKVHPKPGDRVLVSYTGWTTDGALFDSNVLGGQPTVELPVSGGMPGWVEGIQLMTHGAKMRFWMPPKLAFAGVKDKPQGMIVLDVELFVVSSEIMPKRGQQKGRTGKMPRSGPPLPPSLPPGVH